MRKELEILNNVIAKSEKEKFYKPRVTSYSKIEKMEQGLFNVKLKEFVSGLNSYVRYSGYSVPSFIESFTSIKKNNFKEMNDETKKNVKTVIIEQLKVKEPPKDLVAMFYGFNKISHKNERLKDTITSKKEKKEYYDDVILNDYYETIIKIIGFVIDYELSDYDKSEEIIKKIQLESFKIRFEKEFPKFNYENINILLNDKFQKFEDQEDLKELIITKINNSGKEVLEKYIMDHLKSLQYYSIIYVNKLCNYLESEDVKENVKEKVYEYINKNFKDKKKFGKNEYYLAKEMKTLLNKLA